MLVTSVKLLQICMSASYGYFHACITGNCNLTISFTLKNYSLVLYACMYAANTTPEYSEPARVKVLI